VTVWQFWLCLSVSSKAIGILERKGIKNLTSVAVVSEAWIQQVFLFMEQKQQQDLRKVSTRKTIP
jgi:hypothetical protein